MQWDASEGAGFTAGIPWLPVNPDHTFRNVAVQDADPDSLLSFYRRLLALRRKTPALRSGDLEFLGEDPDVLAYRRTPAGTAEGRKPGPEPEDRGPAVLVVLNFAGGRRTFTLPEGGRVRAGTERAEGSEVGAGTIGLAGYEVLIVETDGRSR